MAVTDDTMKHAAAQAVSGYCERNGLENLELGQLLCVILSAMAAQMSDTNDPVLPVELRRLKAKFGLLVDNGRLKRDAAGKTLAEIELSAGRPRFEVEPAFEALLQLAVGMGHRPPTGEGFEQAFADFLTVAIAFAGLNAAVPPGAARGAPGLVASGPLEEMLKRCGVLGDLPSGWRVPLRVVSWLQELGGDRAGVYTCVKTHQLGRKIEPFRVDRASDRDRHYAAIRTAVGECCGSSREAGIAINGGLAEAFDALANIPCDDDAAGSKHLLALCQTKRYLSEFLRPSGVLFELHKMGCEAEIVKAGAWAKGVTAEELNSATGSATAPARIGNTLVCFARGGGYGVKRETLVKLIAAELQAGGGVTFADWLRRTLPTLAVKRDATALAQGRDERLELIGELKAAVAGPDGAADSVQVCFIVAVYGNALELPDTVAALLPKNVLLLHDAGDAKTTAPGGDVTTTARSLRGFYPVRVAYDQGSSVGPCTLPELARPSKKRA